MKIAFLVPNSAWVILFGTAMVDLNGQFFFQDKADLLLNLKGKGLGLQGKKVVVLEG